MNPNDMFQTENPKTFTREFVLEAWEQGRGELLGFANALDRGQSGITASQLRMAIQLADEEYKRMRSDS